MERTVFKGEMEIKIKGIDEQGNHIIYMPNCQYIRINYSFSADPTAHQINFNIDGSCPEIQAKRM